MKVLIVEDSVSDREMIEEAIRGVSEGFSDFNPELFAIDTIEDEEREMLRGGSFDLAVVDYELLGGGGQDGFDAIDLLKSENIFSEPKVIIFTGRAKEPEHFLEALNRGVFRYVLKPKIPDLKAALTKAFETILKERRLNAISSFADINLRRYILQRGGWEELRRGVPRHMAVMFCDLSRSSKFVKSWRALVGDQVRIAELFRDFFTYASNIIKEHGGTIDKYIGDEVMAYFGGGEEEDLSTLGDNALRAALRIRADFKGWLREAREKFGHGAWPADVELNVKSVVNVGEVIWGVLGTPDYHDVSILTTEVIKAARLMQHVLSPDEQRLADYLKDRGKLVMPGEVWITSELRSRLRQEDYTFGKRIEVRLRDFEEGFLGVCRVQPRRSGPRN